MPSIYAAAVSARAGCDSVMGAVSSWSPALVQGWMYHGNLGALALSEIQTTAAARPLEHSALG